MTGRVRRWTLVAASAVLVSANYGGAARAARDASPPAAISVTASQFPEGITAGPDGALWFTEQAGDAIGRITVGGKVTEYPLHQKIEQNVGGPWCIVNGPDGNLWFTSFSSGRIGRVSPTGTVTVFSVPSSSATAGPYAITAGPDGALWFTELYVNAIGRITANGKVTQYPMSTPGLTASHGMAVGSDHNIWFTAEVVNAIVRLNPTTHAVTTFSLPPLPAGL